MMEILGWILVIGIWALAIYLAKLAIDKICKLIVDLICLPFMISNRKKTHLHYYDHPDRYFDFETGQWQWRTPQDNQ